MDTPTNSQTEEMLDGELRRPTMGSVYNAMTYFQGLKKMPPNPIYKGCGECGIWLLCRKVTVHFKKKHPSSTLAGDERLIMPGSGVLPLNSIVINFVDVMANPTDVIPILHREHAHLGEHGGKRFTKKTSLQAHTVK